MVKEKMKKELLFSMLDIPFSCSMFLESALQKYSGAITPMPKGIEQFIHEWNLALLNVIQQPDICARLGQAGLKILNGSLKAKNFPAACVDKASDVKLQSLHYAIRFSESIRFLLKKISTEKDIVFIDLGSGLSPMAAAVQTEYKMRESYCIDFPEIMDVYNKTAQLVGGRVPTAISWDDAKHLATTGMVNTIISMGTFHYMNIKEQVKRLKFINNNFPNFMVEIKYDADTQKENVFSLDELQKLKIDVQNTSTLETALLQNSMRYLHNFLHAMPNKKFFVQKERSLFISR